MMEVPNCEFGDTGTFMFSDCAVCIQPNAEDLSEIGRCDGKKLREASRGRGSCCYAFAFELRFGERRRYAKVVEALALAKQKAPEFAIDGELQADAALVPSVAASKAPDSPVAGKANVLVFPDLDAANIGYKLVQRLAKAEAYGPITQGLGAPMNDLSRGCSAEDVLGVIAITAVQAQEA